MFMLLKPGTTDSGLLGARDTANTNKKGLFDARKKHNLHDIKLLDRHSERKLIFRKQAGTFCVCMCSCFAFMFCNCLSQVFNRFTNHGVLFLGW